MPPQTKQAVARLPATNARPRLTPPALFRLFRSCGAVLGKVASAPAGCLLLERRKPSRMIKRTPWQVTDRIVMQPFSNVLSGLLDISPTGVVDKAILESRPQT
jgi:hypothetical protein